MRVLQTTIVAATLVSASLLATAAPLAAMPQGLTAQTTALAAQNDASPPLINVRHWRRGRGAAAGFAAGVLLGGAIAGPYYYSGYPPYPYYSRAYPVYGPYTPGDPATAYCLRRFRSYDPYTRTYLGYDGYRHPCP